MLSIKNVTRRADPDKVIGEADLRRPSPGVRCRTCGARNTGGITWCSLCLSEIAPLAHEQSAPATEDRREILDRREVLDRREERRRPVLSSGARAAVMVVGAVLGTGAGLTGMSILGSVL